MFHHLSNKNAASAGVFARLISLLRACLLLALLVVIERAPVQLKKKATGKKQECSVLTRQLLGA